jgi:hypothetical protein
MMYDLNNVSPTSKERSDYDWFERHRDTTHVKPAKVVTHFGDLRPALMKFIAESEAIVGCIAWVSARDFIDLLSQRPVALIVNKEPFLKPTGRVSAARQRESLTRLVGGLRRRDFPEPLNRMYQTRSDIIDPVRCVGHTGARVQNSPLMHHKFAVRLTGGKPTAVWTGSFNWTVNASSSIENAIEIHDPAVAAEYLKEFARVAALSEPLDYLSPSSKPQWHIGTTQESAKAPRAPRKAPAPKAGGTATRKKPARAAAKRTNGAIGANGTTKRATAATGKKTATATRSSRAK